GRTLEGLRVQTLPSNRWELVLVDNASTPPLSLDDLPRHLDGNVEMCREERLGLSFGRLKGIARSRADLLIFIDDDNVLAPDYLANAVRILAGRPRLGLGGGRSIPGWESAAPPGDWVADSYRNLALRDLGDGEILSVLSHPPSYPACAPIGAGMIARREALRAWAQSCLADGSPTGRRGSELTSGEDCDMVMAALHA